MACPTVSLLAPDAPDANTQELLSVGSSSTAEEVPLGLGVSDELPEPEIDSLFEVV